MRRSAIALTAAIVGLALLWGFRPWQSQRIESPGVAPATPVSAGVTTTAAAPEVTIDEQLVRAGITQESVRASAARQPVRAGKRTPPRKEGFFAKARRVLFGGGRHKPSPFPPAQ